MLKNITEELKKAKKFSSSPNLNFVNIEGVDIKLIEEIDVPTIFPNSPEKYFYLRITDKKGDSIQGYYKEEGENTIGAIENPNLLNKPEIWISPPYRFYSQTSNTENDLEKEVVITEIIFDDFESEKKKKTYSPTESVETSN